MLRRMKDMPTSRIGFEAIGEVEDDDWEETVEPVLRHERADGQKIRLLYSCGAEARDVEERLSDSRYRVSRRPRPVVRARRCRHRRGLDAACRPRPVGPAARQGQKPSESTTSPSRKRGSQKRSAPSQPRDIAPRNA